jgi:hypothetical protein
MNLNNSSDKRERWLTLGRFRIPVFLHEYLLLVQREHCHSQLRDSAIYLMKQGALSVKSDGNSNAQIVTNGDAQGGRQ